MGGGAAGSAGALNTGAGVTSGQGLSLAHFSAQPEPSLTQIHPKHPLLSPNTSCTPPKQPLNAHPIPQKALTSSRKGDECKPLPPAPPMRAYKLLLATSSDAIQVK
jgi:hypothetical protein